MKVPTSRSPVQKRPLEEKSSSGNGLSGGIVVAMRLGSRTVCVSKGMASVENSISLAPDTLLLTGSVSKQFVGALTLKLAKEGLIDLHADVSHVLPEFPHKGISLCHLLNHSSGLRETETLFALAGIREHDYLSASDHLATLSRQKQLLFRPGTRFAYTNINYLVAASVIEQTTKVQLPVLAHDHLFRDSALGATRFHRHPDEILPKRGASYRMVDGCILRADRPFSLVGPSGLWSTAEELLAWTGFRKQLFCDSPSFTLTRHLIPAISGWADAKAGCYQFGLISLDHSVGQLLHHSGSDQGYSAEACEIGKTVAIAAIANHQEVNASRIVRKIVTKIRRRRLTEGKLDKVLTELLDCDLRLLPIKKELEQLSVQIPIALSRALEGTYICDEALAPIRLVKGDAGFELWRGGQRDLLRPQGRQKLVGSGYELTFSLATNCQTIRLNLSRAGCLEFTKM